MWSLFSTCLSDGLWQEVFGTFENGTPRLVKLFSQKSLIHLLPVKERPLFAHSFLKTKWSPHHWQRRLVSAVSYILYEWCNQFSVFWATRKETIECFFLSFLVFFKRFKVLKSALYNGKKKPCRWSSYFNKSVRVVLRDALEVSL
jgi:hypothetical protein